MVVALGVAQPPASLSHARRASSPGARLRLGGWLEVTQGDHGWTKVHCEGGWVYAVVMDAGWYRWGWGSTVGSRET